MHLKKIGLLILLFMVFFMPSYSDAPKISESDNEYSLFTGIFDTIDKEGDDKTSLFGVEHKNTSLFKDTIMGKFSPVTGGFISKKKSVYLYTGVQAEYDVGFLKIIPSFAPGYYDSGDGKDLGSALEFKSEIRFDFNIFENSKFGYSYSHISNNDWGEGGKNPGVNNKQISFSKSF